MRTIMGRIKYSAYSQIIFFLNFKYVFDSKLVIIFIIINFKKRNKLIYIEVL